MNNTFLLISKLLSFEIIIKCFWNSKFFVNSHFLFKPLTDCFRYFFFMIICKLNKMVSRSTVSSVDLALAYWSRGPCMSHVQGEILVTLNCVSLHIAFHFYPLSPWYDGNTFKKDVKSRHLFIHMVIKNSCKSGNNEISFISFQYKYEKSRPFIIGK